LYFQYKLFYITKKKKVFWQLALFIFSPFLFFIVFLIQNQVYRDPTTLILLQFITEVLLHASTIYPFYFWVQLSSAHQTKSLWSNLRHEGVNVNYWRQASPTMCKWDYLISHLAHGGGLPLTPINCILMCPPCEVFVCVWRT
jgi:hypothetical protein